MDFRDLILMQLLAKRDAIWSVQRNFTMPFGTNLYAARQKSEQGIPWASSKAKTDDRVRAQRALESLAGEGRVKVVRSGGRASHVLFGDQAECDAQLLAGLPCIGCAWVWKVAEVVLRSETWIAEDDLLPTWVEIVQPIDGTREDRLDALEQLLVPFMARRWIEGHATSNANARYRRGRLAGNASIPDVDLSSSPDISDEAYEEHRAAFLEAIHDMKMRRPSSSDIGHVPLSVADSPLDLYHV